MMKISIAFILLAVCVFASPVPQDKSPDDEPAGLSGDGSKDGAKDGPPGPGAPDKPEAKIEDQGFFECVFKNAVFFGDCTREKDVKSCLWDNLSKCMSGMNKKPSDNTPETSDDRPEESSSEMPKEIEEPSNDEPRAPSDEMPKVPSKDGLSGDMPEVPSE